MTDCPISSNEQLASAMRAAHEYIFRKGWEEDSPEWRRAQAICSMLTRAIYALPFDEPSAPETQPASNRISLPRVTVIGRQLEDTEPDYMAYYTSYDAARDALASKDREIERLRAALERYGRHEHPNCHDLTLKADGSFGPRNGCLCGLDTALSGRSAPETKAHEHVWLPIGDRCGPMVTHECQCGAAMYIPSAAPETKPIPPGAKTIPGRLMHADWCPAAKAPNCICGHNESAFDAFNQPRPSRLVGSPLETSTRPATQPIPRCTGPHDLQPTDAYGDDARHCTVCGIAEYQLKASAQPCDHPVVNGSMLSDGSYGRCWCGKCGATLPLTAMARDANGKLLTEGDKRWHLDPPV